MRFLVLSALLVLAFVSRSAEPLQPLANDAMARVLAWGQVLFDDRGIRVVEVPVTIGECWGALKSCPDIDLYVTYNTGDLYSDAVVYRLPAAKGWKVVGLTSPNTVLIETAIPEANVNEEERNRWRKQSFQVTVEEAGASIEQK